MATPLLTAGVSAMKHGRRGRPHARIIFYSSGRLAWCAPEQPRVICDDGSRSITLADTVGTQVQLKGPRRMKITAATRALDVELESEAVRDALLGEVRQLQEQEAHARQQSILQLGSFGAQPNARRKSSRVLASMAEHERQHRAELAAGPAAESAGGSQSESEQQGRESAVPSQMERLWLPNRAANECMYTGCGAAFSTFKRRHHCRVCGLIFCQLHSANRCIVPAAFGYSGRSKKRTCDACCRKLNEGLFQTPAEVLVQRQALAQAPPPQAPSPGDRVFLGSFLKCSQSRKTWKARDFVLDRSGGKAMLLYSKQPFVQSGAWTPTEKSFLPIGSQTILCDHQGKPCSFQLVTSTRRLVVSTRSAAEKARTMQVLLQHIPPSPVPNTAGRVVFCEAGLACEICRRRFHTVKKPRKFCSQCARAVCALCSDGGSREARLCNECSVRAPTGRIEVVSAALWGARMATEARMGTTDGGAPTAEVFGTLEVEVVYNEQQALSVQLCSGNLAAVSRHAFFEVEKRFAAFNEMHRALQTNNGFASEQLPLFPAARRFSSVAKIEMTPILAAKLAAYTNSLLRNPAFAGTFDAKLFLMSPDLEQFGGSVPSTDRSTTILEAIVMTGSMGGWLQLNVEAAVAARFASESLRRAHAQTRRCTEYEEREQILKTLYCAPAESHSARTSVRDQRTTAVELRIAREQERLQQQQNAAELVLVDRRADEQDRRAARQEAAEHATQHREEYSAMHEAGEKLAIAAAALAQAKVDHGLESPEWLDETVTRIMGDFSISNVLSSGGGVPENIANAWTDVLRTHPEERVRVQREVELQETGTDLQRTSRSEHEASSALLDAERTAIAREDAKSLHEDSLIQQAKDELERKSSMLLDPLRHLRVNQLAARDCLAQVQRTLRGAEQNMERAEKLLTPAAAGVQETFPCNLVVPASARPGAAFAITVQGLRRNIMCLAGWVPGQQVSVRLKRNPRMPDHPSMAKTKTADKWAAFCEYSNARASHINKQIENCQAIVKASETIMDCEPATSSAFPSMELVLAHCARANQKLKDARDQMEEQEDSLRCDFPAVWDEYQALVGDFTASAPGQLDSVSSVIGLLARVSAQHAKLLKASTTAHCNANSRSKELQAGAKEAKAQAKAIQKKMKQEKADREAMMFLAVVTTGGLAGGHAAAAAAAHTTAAASMSLPHILSMTTTHAAAGATATTSVAASAHRLHAMHAHAHAHVHGVAKAHAHAAKAQHHVAKGAHAHVATVHHAHGATAHAHAKQAHARASQAKHAAHTVNQVQQVAVDPSKLVQQVLDKVKAKVHEKLTDELVDMFLDAVDATPEQRAYFKAFRSHWDMLTGKKPATVKEAAGLAIEMGKIYENGQLGSEQPDGCFHRLGQIRDEYQKASKDAHNLIGLGS
jgi:hypothetical protein